MTTLSITKPYGTYQKFQYQTVDLEPMKKLGLALLKLIAVVFVALALVIVALTMFQLVLVAANFIGGWLIANGLQLLTGFSAGAFMMWGMKK